MNPRTRMVIFVSLILGLAPALLVHSAGQPGAKPANPINILTQKLKDSPEHVGKVMGERFADYIIYGADSSSPYGIKDGMKVQINSISVAWVAEKVKQNKAADVAQLYLVMGAGDQELTWLSQEPDLAATLKDKRTRRAADLSKKMKPWAMPLDARGVGQYSQGDLALWVRRFLGTDEKDDSYMSSAAQVSFSILKDSNIQKELGKSVPKNQGQDEGGAVSTGGAGTGGQPMTGSAKGFDYNSLFRGGAVIKDVTYQSGQSGQISIKMYTVKENGVLVNKVGIFDITNQSDTFGQKFSIPAGAGESTFALDDRKGGMSQYTLKFVPSGSETLIYFSREGSSDPKPTSVSELLTKRADQAIAAGDITDVGGKPYYVLGQGGAKGSLLFFSEDLPKRLAAGGSLTPEMAAEVCQRGSDGNNVILKHDKGPDLGKAADGKPYHLVFNREYGYWEVMSGEGDPEPQPAPPAPAGGTTPANPTGAETSKGGQGGCTVDTAKTLLEQQPNNAMAADPLTVSLGEALLKQGFAIMTSKDTGQLFNSRHALVVPKNISSACHLFMPMVPAWNSAPWRRNELGVIAGRYLAVSPSDAEVWYWDLTQHPIFKGKETGDNGTVGTVQEDGTINVQERGLLADALQRAKFKLPEGKTQADLDNNLGQVLKNENKPYVITGGSQSGKLMIKLNGQSCNFWPDIERDCLKLGGYKDVVGQGSEKDQSNAFDWNTTPAKDQRFPRDGTEASYDQFGAHDVVYKMQETDQAALYASSDSAHSAQAQHLYLKLRGYNKADGKLFGISPFVLVFDRGRKGVEPPADLSAIHMDGVTLAKPSAAGQVLMRHGDKTSGFWYYVVNPQLTCDKENNCFGPVLWWGMTKDKVQTEMKRL